MPANSLWKWKSKKHFNLFFWSGVSHKMLTIEKMKRDLDELTADVKEFLCEHCVKICRVAEALLMEAEPAEPVEKVELDLTDLDGEEAFRVWADQLEKVEEKERAEKAEKELIQILEPGPPAATD